LAAPVTSIINLSLPQGIVLDQWKISRITPVPKIFPPKHVESDVRPIAVTNAIAKLLISLLADTLMTSTLISLEVFMIVQLLVLF